MGMNKKKFDTPADHMDLEEIRRHVNQTADQMVSLEKELDMAASRMFPADGDLPSLDMVVEVFDYEGEIQRIKMECRETLESISSLYLTEETAQKKNIGNIIKNDALALADLNFSLSCSRRGLINLMKQIDMGVSDPEMYTAVATFQKEIRDSIKLAYDIQKKMKEFYCEMRGELQADEIETGEDVGPVKTDLYLIDTRELNKTIEKYQEAKKKEEDDGE